MTSRELLFQITRCPIVNVAFHSQTTHPCRKIIESQNAASLSTFQLSEPWNGLLETAPILFLSSNPSIDSTEEYPTWSTPDDVVEDFFSNRFAGKQKEWVKDGNHFLKTDGFYSDAVKFWSAVRKRAEELFQRNVIPGIDYALSEVVHCKSRQEIGVVDAMDFCSKRYLKEILSISGAVVIVILGDKAKMALKNALNISESEINGSTLVQIGGRERYVCFLPHPNAWKKKTFESVLSPDVLMLLRLTVQKYI
jgi:hypothetical protein